jgi:REP element-mobilizing transposase RayT
VPHVQRAAFRKLPAHVTLRVQADVPTLRKPQVVREIERTFAAGCDRDGFRLVHYSLLGNHAHLIVEAEDRTALGRGMKAVGARLARAVNRVAERSGRVLADRYHHRVLTTPREVHHALRYVLLNARRHAKQRRPALKGGPALDRASSGRWFDGWQRQPPIRDRDEGATSARSPVANARWWLLRLGWRRHGLLDPADVPG